MYVYMYVCVYIYIYIYIIKSAKASSEEGKATAEGDLETALAGREHAWG